MLNSNRGRTYRLRDIFAYVENRHFRQLHSESRPPSGGTRSNVYTSLKSIFNGLQF